jgi:RHS repeat-associated protein
MRVQSPNGRVVRATYDTRGHVKTVTDSGTIVAGQVATTRYEWNMTWDAVERIVLPEQDSTVLSYDASGNRQWQQDGRGPMSRVSFGYSPSTGLLTSIRLPAAVKADSFHYDAIRANLDSSWTPIGFRTVHFADALGRDTLVLSPIDSLQTKTSSQRIIYDPADRVKETWSLGPAMPYQLDLATSFVPDTMAVAADTLLVTNRYDTEGNLLGVFSATTLANYDLLRLRVQDVRLYDAANRLVSQQLGSGPSSFSYDPAGNPIGLGFRNGIEVTQTFDVLNRVVGRVIPQVDYAQSNCAGHIHDALTYPICMLHVPLYPNNGTGYRISADTNTLTYDAMGNILEADSRDARISRTYYLNGAVQTDTQRLRAIVGPTFPKVFGMRYGYDRNGRRTWLAGAGDSTAYAYNSTTGLLSQVRDPTGRLFTFAYDSAGRLDTLLTYPGNGQPWGIRETTVLDPDARVVRRVRATNGGTGDIDSLRYDARGKVIEARAHDAASGHTNERTTMAYDGLGAVVGSEVYNANLLTWQSEEYRNDGLGNVWWNKSITAAGVEVPHWTKYNITTGALTLRHEVPTGSCTSDAWRRDTLAQAFAVGNVVLADQANRHCIVSNQNYSRQVATNNFYRADNRLMVVQRYDVAENNDQSGTWEEYRYDALGRRVVIHALRDSLCHSSSGSGYCDNTDQFTVWDGDQIFGEERWTYGATPTSTTLWYLHGAELDHPLETLDGRVPIYDWRGLAQASRWTNGTPADCSLTGGACITINWPAGEGVYYKRPDPQLSGPVPTWVGSLLANGEDGTTLLFRRNRYYDPASGRFTQEDPIGLAGGLNLYGFAQGDPINFHDPFGLQRRCTGHLTSAVWGCIYHRVEPAQTIVYAYSAAVAIVVTGGIAAEVVSAAAPTTLALSSRVATTIPAWPKAIEGSRRLIESVLRTGERLEELTPAIREKAAQYYDQVAELVGGKHAEMARLFNLERARFLREGGLIPPGTLPEFIKRVVGSKQ